MPRDFPSVRDGTPIEPYLFNVAFDELRRMRRMQGDGLIVVEGADSATSPPVISLPFDQEFFIRLTGPYSSGYPWEEVQFTAGRGVELTGLTGTTATDPAYERRTGETGLPYGDGTIYQARRSPASGEVVFPAKVAGCQLCVAPTDFCTGAAVGGTFTVTQGGTTVGTCMTTGVAIPTCCITVPASGTYSWTFVPSNPIYASQSGTKVVTCPAMTTIAITLFRIANVTIGGQVQGQCDDATGVCSPYHYTVTIAGPVSGSLGTTGTWSFGPCTPGTYTVTISDPNGRYNPATLTYVLDGCHLGGTQNVTLTVAGGFACMGAGAGFGSVPWKTTLHLLDAVYGSCTLTYDPVAHVWVGTIGPVPACKSVCAPQTVTITYRFPGGAILNYSGFCTQETPSIIPVNIICPPGGEIDCHITWNCPPPFVSDPPTAITITE